MRVSEALYAFIGWLTSRAPVSGPFSSHHDAAPAAALVDAFCKWQGWDEPRYGWEAGVRPYPAEETDPDGIAGVALTYNRDDSRHANDQVPIWIGNSPTTIAATSGSCSVVTFTSSGDGTCASGGLSPGDANTFSSSLNIHPYDRSSHQHRRDVIVSAQEAEDTRVVVHVGSDARPPVVALEQQSVSEAPDTTFAADAGVRIQFGDEVYLLPLYRVPETTEATGDD